jgi:hypothetical protein
MFVGSAIIVSVAGLIGCLGCFTWWLVSDYITENWKVKDGRIRKRRTRNWQFGE